MVMIEEYQVWANDDPTITVVNGSSALGAVTQYYIERDLLGDLDKRIYARRRHHVNAKVHVFNLVATLEITPDEINGHDYDHVQWCKEE